jgi:hypothetical protein
MSRVNLGTPPMKCERKAFVLLYDSDKKVYVLLKSVNNYRWCLVGLRKRNEKIRVM